MRQRIGDLIRGYEDIKLGNVEKSTKVVEEGVKRVTGVRPPATE